MSLIIRIIIRILNQVNVNLRVPIFHSEKVMVNLVDMSQMTLYTRVLVNITKRMKKTPILRCIFLHQSLYLF